MQAVSPTQERLAEQIGPMPMPQVEDAGVAVQRADADNAVERGEL